MFEENKHLSKKPVEVELYLDDGSLYFGRLSVKPNERPSDLMNDERQFLPFEKSDGETIIVRKSIITKVVQLNQHAKQIRLTDPYKILGVSRNISDADLTKAYRKACAQNHPDKLQSSGMAASFIQMANSQMTRINDAYHRIMDERRQREPACGD